MSRSAASMGRPKIARRMARHASQDALANSPEALISATMVPTTALPIGNVLVSGRYLLDRVLGCGKVRSDHAASPTLKDVLVQPHTLRVIVFITAKPDQVDAMRRLLVSLIAPSRAERGCLGYELLQNTNDPTDFTVVEEWESEQHYGGHFEAEHIKQALGPFAELGSKPFETWRYERLES